MSQSNEYNVETFFPFKLVEEVIDILKEKNCTFLTYSELDLSLFHQRLDELSYALEFVHYQMGNPHGIAKLSLWTEFLLYKLFKKERLASFLKRKDMRKTPAVILQHDADQQPFKTIDLMKLEERCGVVSSSYFFKTQNFDTNGNYTLDINELQRLEQKGFEIGYHLNAYELADYDLEKAFKIVNSDLDFFNRHFNLRTFVPHGGHPSKNGLNNHLLPYKGRLRKYPWCYNGFGFSHHAMWSDGNIYFEDLEDPRIVASNLKNGQRAMFLMHPQYYGNELSSRYSELPVSRESWWKNLWNL